MSEAPPGYEHHELDEDEELTPEDAVEFFNISDLPDGWGYTPEFAHKRGFAAFYGRKNHHQFISVEIADTADGVKFRVSHITTNMAMPDAEADPDVKVCDNQAELISTVRTLARQGEQLL